MILDKKYKFSFTATSLRTKDFVKIAQWEKSRDIKELELQIGNGKSSTGKRLLLEIKKWENVLTSSQLNLLKTGSFKASNEMAFLAVCKCYSFIREFMVEVVREKYLVYDYELTDGDYLSFFRRKSEIDSSLEDLTEITQKKVKQVTFKMLEQANIINDIKSRNIQPQLLETETQKVTIEDNPELLKVFLYTDLYINQLKETYV